MAFGSLTDTLQVYVTKFTHAIMHLSIENEKRGVRAKALLGFLMRE
jgi:hypothetical protein